MTENDSVRLPLWHTQPCAQPTAAKVPRQLNACSAEPLMNRIDATRFLLSGSIGLAMAAGAISAFASVTRLDAVPAVSFDEFWCRKAPPSMERTGVSLFDHEARALRCCTPRGEIESSRWHEPDDALLDATQHARARGANAAVLNHRFSCGRDTSATFISVVGKAYSCP